MSAENLLMLSRNKENQIIWLNEEEESNESEVESGLEAKLPEGTTYDLSKAPNCFDSTKATIQLGNYINGTL